MTYIDGAACWRAAANLLAFVILWLPVQLLCCVVPNGMVSTWPFQVVIALAVVRVYVLVFDRVFERGRLPEIYSNNLQHLNDAATYLQHVPLLCFLFLR